MGFPGLNMTGCTIKLAQQNYGEHFKVMKAIAETFEPDIIFPLMDLAVEANALGRFTLFPQTDSATVPKAPFSLDELERGSQINIARDTRLLGYVETVKLMCIGFPDSILKGAYVIGPYSLAALLMGAEEAALATILSQEDMHAICRFTTEKIQEYIRLLIAAGAQVIGILEPSAVMLGPDQFAAFSAGYVRHIIESCKYADVATIYHTCGNTMCLAEKMVDAGVNAISLDSPVAGVDLPAVARSLSSNVVIMGNINPTGNMIHGKPQDVEEEVLNLLKQMRPFPNFILSTGCDLPQETPLENIHAFMRTGRRYRLH
ncbi:uroporphyrinogen decarboxylase family protein [Candidatus Sumerlaeota bacterium]|nr:uroporphyrinogen decarboxylase family protein [Candidatus Sumerlaeota bacterium]